MAKTHRAKLTDKSIEFISLTAHQLKTPLSIIRWLLQSLDDADSQPLSAEQNEILTDITKENDKMIQLVDLLLNITRIESGRIELKPEPIEIHTFLSKLIQEQTRIASLKNQRILFEASNDPIFSYFDEMLVANAFSNLISNAIKYTPQNGAITISVNVRKTKIITCIKDTGYGIPKNDFRKIFTKFFRAENVLQRDTEGTGLGLYLTKLIIKTSKGKIWFTSEEKKGTSFFVELPKLTDPESHSD